MKAVITFGRFQPPTKAHEEIFSKVVHRAVEEVALPIVFVSESVDSKKNPLPVETRLQIVKLMSPFVRTKAIKDPVAALKWLSSIGYKEVFLFAGDDRIDAKYKDFLRYIRPDIPEEKRIPLDRLELISAGKRDPEADNMEGISATKARHLATVGDFIGFKSIVPSCLSEENAKQLYMDVRKGLCLI